MQIGISKTLQKKLGMNAIVRGMETDLRFCWEVDLIRYRGHKLLLVQHADTRYTMVYANIPKETWVDLDVFILNEIARALRRKGFEEADIECYFRAMGRGEMTSLHSRNATMGLKQAADRLEGWFGSEDSALELEGSVFQSALTEYVNNDYCKPAGHEDLTETVQPNRFFGEEVRKLIQLYR